MIKENNKWINYLPVLIAIAVLILGGIGLTLSQKSAAKQFKKSATTIDSLVQKIEALNTGNIQFSDTALVKQITSLQKAELELEKQQFKTELTAQKQELFASNVAFFGVGTLIGFIALLFLIPKEVERLAKVEAQAQVTEKIAGVVNQRVEAIAAILNRYDREAELIKRKKIYEYKSLQKEVKEILLQSGFTDYNFTETIDSSDIVFIQDDENLKSIPRRPDTRNKTPEQAKKINDEWAAKKQKVQALWQPIVDIIEAPANRKKAFFFFSSKGIHFPVELLESFEQRARINFVTNPAQIYGNLLNTLKYQHQLSKNQ